jgi:hypothetical protein
MFGLVFVKENSGDVSSVVRGEDAINYIKTELLAIEPQLDATVGPGRLTKAGAWALLARLYMNAAVYRDVYATSFTFRQDEMDKVIEYCDKIINSNQFALASEYFSFSVTTITIIKNSICD